MGDYSISAAVHIFADTEAALARACRTAEAAGCRIAAQYRIGVAATEPACTPGAALLVELEEEDAVQTALPLLDRAMRDAREGARRSVISTSAGLLDLVTSRAWHCDILHLCEADEDERTAAIAWACARPSARLHDTRRERGLPIVQPVSDTIAAPSDPRADAARIRRMIRARRLRTHFFRADLFADPAWDMLLDLMAARLERKKVAVSSLCIAAAVPPTTALRWLGVLTEQGLVVRIADPEDGRRIHVELSEPTVQALGAWLGQTRELAAETA